MVTPVTFGCSDALNSEYIGSVRDSFQPMSLDQVTPHLRINMIEYTQRSLPSLYKILGCVGCLQPEHVFLFDVVTSPGGQCVMDADCFA